MEDLLDVMLLENMKKYYHFIILLVLVLFVIHTWVCANAPELKRLLLVPNENTEESHALEPEVDLPTGIGIITAVPSQSYSARFVNKLKKLSNFVNAPAILHEFWPVNFMDRQNEVQDIVLDMLNNPEIGALVISDAIPGCDVAIKSVADLRNPFFSVVCNPDKDFNTIASQVNLVIALDWESLMCRMVQQADQMGANTFVFYYTWQDTRSDFWEQMLVLVEDTCVDLELDFIPEMFPKGETSPSAIEFLEHDLPVKVEEYGSNTAFFSTVMQPTLIVQVIEQGAFFAMPRYPSPYYGFPEALEIEVTDEDYGDYELINEQIARVVLERGANSRVSSFLVDSQDLELRTAYEYVAKWLKDELPGTDIDLHEIQQIMESIANTPCYLRFYEEDGLVYDNYVLYCFDPYIVH